MIIVYLVIGWLLGAGMVVTFFYAASLRREKKAGTDKKWEAWWKNNRQRY